NYSDIGLLKRNADLVPATANVISRFFDSSKKFIDYGAGYGVFVRMMRDRGYDFYWQDRYCENLYAKEFEYKNGDKYELLTAYEVFEHLPDPVPEINLMLKHSDSILFSTYLLPEGNPKPGEWWYYATDHGQHVSIYTRKSLEVLAGISGKRYYTNGKNIHLFSGKKISNLYFKLLTMPYSSAAFSVLSGKKSLLDDDYKKVIGKLKQEGRG
ncbi:MAG: class I SAM-dependent methyltransferase, partial [Ignavibacteria bacterium]|nr:class I SAM-dependent methyltransferase [Ignavibacteria bacterium]